MNNEGKPNINFKRVYLIVIALILFWVLLEFRLFIIQIKNHDFYVEHSRIQSEKKISLEAWRGEIFDRNGERLATNLIQYDLGIDLKEVADKNKIASSFANAFQKPKSYYLKKLNRNRDFIYLARKVPEKKLNSITMQDDPGLVILQGYRRFYPYGKYGSQLIGFTNVDDQGVSGLELQFERQLSGSDGWTFLLADARRRFGYDVDLPRILPEPGRNIVLTLDKNYQTIVEDELDLGIKKYDADFGMAILMNPISGEILAMYSSPGFDPNNPGFSEIDQRKNRTIVDIFEPGSTFKIFPAAIMLQENIKKPNDIVFCENGSYRFYNHTINDSKKYAWLSFRKVIENSSNIGMVKLSADISKYTLYKYLKSFGFDSHTGINLIGESSGILTTPDEFSGLSKGAISFGQEVGVTALQMANAYSAIVNGGFLMRPYVIQAITDSKNRIVEENRSLKIRRVISSTVAETLKEFMNDVVRRGTGNEADIPGIKIGGKTGTAQKYDKKTKRYLKNNYLASFIGFAPYDNPEYVLAIFIDNPKPYYYGGQVAAPIFASIMKRILNFAPINEFESKSYVKIAQKNSNIPNFKGLPVNAVEEYCEIKSVSFTVQGDGSHVLKQTNASDELQIVLGIPKIKNHQVPNLKGLTVREALNQIDFSQLRVKIIGQGRIVKQSIKPGTIIKNKRELLLTCSN